MAATAESLRKRRTTKEQRNASKSIATPAIHTVSRIVELLTPWELSSCQRFITYQMMLQDPDVWAATESRITAIEVAQSNPRFEYDRDSPRSVWLKDYLEYCLSSMQKSTRQQGRDCAESVYNGIAPFEIVSNLVSDGSEYDGYFALDTLIYIDPLTIDKLKPFVTEDGGRKVTDWRQSRSAFRDTSGALGNTDQSETGSVRIDARKIAICSYSASSGRPLGTSVFDSIYTTWREKGLIQEYLLMGIQKDLSGTPILRVPLDLFEKAKDPKSDAAATMRELTEQMTNLHQGNATFSILPADAFSDTGAGALQYDMTFKGVEGGNKQFDLVAILEQKKKTIYNAMGASDLIAGESGGGSYNLLEGKANQKAYYAKRDNLIIDDMWNQQIIPYLLRLNTFKEKRTDIPKYVSAEVQPVSLDEWGKAVNRTARLLPAVPDVGNAILSKLGIQYRIPEDTTPDEYRELLFDFIEPSKTGSGNGSSGSGDTQSGGSQSDTNDENK